MDFFKMMIPFLPKLKGFDYARAMPFLLDSYSIVTKIDANHDDVIDGKEKLQAAKNELLEILEHYPEIKDKFALDPEKTEKFINSLVETLNIIVK